LAYMRIHLLDVGGSPHYMIKEIHEEPSILKRVWETQRERISEAAERVAASNRIYIVGSGSSYNAGLVLHYTLASHAKRASTPIPSGEYGYYRGTVAKGDTVIAISQSGHTGDTVEAARTARRSGALVVGVTNNPASPLAESSDYVIDIMAGREEAVTATKTFTAQLYALLLLASEASRISGGSRIDGLEGLPRTLLSTISSLEPGTRRIAVDVYRYQNMFSLGEGIGYGVAREASLKLKEAAGVYAEALQISEARHGPKALIGRRTPVYCTILTERDLAHLTKLLRDLGGVEVPIYVVTSIDVGGEVEERAVEVIRVGSAAAPAASILATAFYQLLSYYISISRLLDPDMPRLLTKVVA